MMLTVLMLAVLRPRPWLRLRRGLRRGLRLDLRRGGAGLCHWRRTYRLRGRCSIRISPIWLSSIRVSAGLSRIAACTLRHGTLRHGAWRHSTRRHATWRHEIRLADAARPFCRARERQRDRLRRRKNTCGMGFWWRQTPEFLRRWWQEHWRRRRRRRVVRPFKNDLALIDDAIFIFGRRRQSLEIIRIETRRRFE